MSNAQDDLTQRLDRLEQHVSALGAQLAALRGVPEVDADDLLAPDMISLQSALAALEKQIGRAGREQLKANSIAEARGEQLAAAFEQLRAAETRREAEFQALREQQRLDVAQAILPALDGLDAALRAGRQLLAQTTRQEAQPRESWWQRFLGNNGGASPSPAGDVDLHAALESWLHGLTFVAQRLLSALEAQGVRPIEAKGRPFDPLMQVAIETVPASPSHPSRSVVEELRRGYRVGDRVLRYAEVIVAADVGAALEEGEK